MNPVRLENRVALDEGFRAEPYQDTVGVWTYGYGTTLDPMGNPVAQDTPPIDEKNARRLLRADIYNAITDAWIVCPSFGGLSAVRREVLTNMAYNLGRARMSNFRRMLAAIQAGDYSRAADEMRDSKWHRQVGHRAERLAQAMKAGEWPDETWHI